MKERIYSVRYILTTLVLMLFLFAVPTLEVKASEEDTLLANLAGDSVPGELGSFSEGVSAVKSGYAIYVVDSAGNGKSPNAVLVTSTPTNYFGTSSNYYWSINTRLGGYHITKSTPISAHGVPWGAPIDLSSGWGSRQNEIRAYMATQVSGHTNAWQTICDIWGTDFANQWASNDWQLILEPIYTFRGWFHFTVELSIAGHVVTEKEFNTSADAPYFVGNVQGLASMMANYIPVYASANGRTLSLGSITARRIFSTTVGSSPMSSGYLKGMAHTLKLSSPLGGLAVSSFAPTKKFSLSELNSYGVGICALSSSTLGIIPPVTTTPSPHSYEGYLYTLSCTGMNGSSSSNATFQGTFYAESSASGDDAYALASSKASGLSYTGSVPSVVFNI